MYKTSPEPYNRPSSVASTAGHIPAVATMDSGVKMPDNNIMEFYNEKAREQWAITKQTYRTTPLIEPKPKVRRDWATGCYLRHMEGPGWHTLPKTIMVQDPSKLKSNNDGLVNLQYNSPINLYSPENVHSTLYPGQQGSSPSPSYRGPSAGSSVSPQPQYKSNLKQPIQVDITMSPTYQFLHDEQEPRRHSPKYSPVTGQHSPGAPVAQRGFKNLMNSLHVSDH